MLFDLIIIFLKLALERYSSGIKLEILKWISHHSNLNFSAKQQTKLYCFAGFTSETNGNQQTIYTGLLTQTIADASMGVLNSSWNKTKFLKS